MQATWHCIINDGDNGGGDGGGGDGDGDKKDNVVNFTSKAKAILKFNDQNIHQDFTIPYLMNFGHIRKIIS